MTQVPTNRTEANTVAEHNSDHNVFAAQHNELDGHAADTAAHDLDATIAAAIAALVAGAPGALDTLDELAAALGDDANFATTVTNALAGKSATDHGHASNLFTAQAAPAYQAGLLFYGSDNEALSFYNNEADINLNIGQEVWVRVRNSSGSTITNGQAVYVNGNHAGTGLPTVALAKADALATAGVVGLATHSIENNTIGYVTAQGVIHGLNTSGFSNGDRLFLSAATAGALTATEPSLPNISVGVAVVTKASGGTAGSLQVLLRLPATPVAHAATHNAGGGDALASDAAAATASLRTLGTGATQAAVGSHAHTGTYEPAGTVSTHAAAADPHTGYVLESLVDAAGDLVVGTAADTVGRLAKGSALQILQVNAGATALEWATASGANIDGAGTGAVAAAHTGDTATASSTQAIAIGKFASANTGAEAIAIGGGVSATAAPTATAQGGIAIGASDGTAVAGARASAASGIAIGSGTATVAGANASLADAIAIGKTALAGGTFSVAIGSNATTGNGNGGICIGGAGASNAPRTNAANAIAIGGSIGGSGNGARAEGANAIAIGSGDAGSVAGATSYIDSIAIGRGSAANNTAREIALGSFTATGAAAAIALGAGISATSAATASGQGSIAVGASNATGVNGAKASGTSSIAIGSGDASTAGASATHDGAVVLGKGVASTATDQVNVGTKRIVAGTPNTAPADAVLIAGQTSLWLDESGDVLSFKAKRAAGTVLSGGLSPTTHAHSGTYEPAGTVTTHAAAADPHTGYVLESLLDAKGDLIAASANDTPARLAVGTDGQVLTADAASTPGVKWATPGGGGNAIYGDGSDGVVNFDGSTTVLGLAPSSSVYTLTRDIFLATGSQVSGTATINTGNFRIFCIGTFMIGASATVHRDGANASGATAGAAPGFGSMIGATSGGAAGGNGSGNGVAGVNGGTQAAAAGGSGGAGGAAFGGTAGGAAGTATAPTAVNGGFRSPLALMLSRTLALTGLNTGGGGGGGGGSGGTGGGGGSGAGFLAIFVKDLVNSGTIRARGGNGANGVSGNSGGGGGGGGGLVALVYNTFSGNAATAPGGTKGNAIGTGSNGSDGSAGTVITLVNA